MFLEHGILARSSAITLLGTLLLFGCGSGSEDSVDVVTTSPEVPTLAPPPPPSNTIKPLADIVVDVTVNMRHEVGGISTLDRRKFFTIHSSITDKEWGNSDNSTGLSDEDIRLRDTFYQDYDVYLGRNNGGMPWRLNRLSGTAVDGRIDMVRSEMLGEQDKQQFYIDSYNTQVESFDKLELRASNMMQGGQLSMYPQKEFELSCDFSQCNNTNEWLSGFDALADFYVSYLSHYFGRGGNTGEPKPRFIEVMNEPILSAAKYRTTPQAISDLHSIVAKRIKAVHPDVKVGGYTAAWPGLEERDFATFDERWKVFIDTAGKDMDFYSIHIYDSYRGGKQAFRSGANSEAILDMLDQYSLLQIGERKPWAISEYGYFTPTSIEKSAIKNVGYSKELDWLNIRSFSSLLMGFLERPDQIISSIPFHLNKALWYASDNGGVGADGKRYSTRLFIMEKELSGEQNIRFDENANWIYSDILLWYQLWQDVNGERVDSHSSEIDVQADSYLDGNTLYLILNNLELEAKDVHVNIAELNSVGIASIESRHLYWDQAKNGATLKEEMLNNDTKVINLEAQATRVLAITFESPPLLLNTSKETRYFAQEFSSFRQRITGGQTLEFAIDNVNIPASQGEAVLRIGVGRKHDKSKFPNVMINGESIAYRQDYRGYYDNDARDDFFGLLEVPIPLSVLQQDNTISLSFADSGGTVTTVGMQVFDMSAGPSRLPPN